MVDMVELSWNLTGASAKSPLWSHKTQDIEILQYLMDWRIVILRMEAKIQNECYLYQDVRFRASIH